MKFLNENDYVSPHFKVKELLSKQQIMDIKAAKSWDYRWFISQELVNMLEFNKSYWREFYKKKYRDDFIDVYIIVVKPGAQNRVLRKPCHNWSQHGFMNAIDFDIKIKLKSGVIEANYKEVFREIMMNQKPFLNAGITTIEHPDYAKTWCHQDRRWTGMKEIFVVKPSRRKKDH